MKRCISKMLVMIVLVSGTWDDARGDANACVRIKVETEAAQPLACAQVDVVFTQSGDTGVCVRGQTDAQGGFVANARATVAYRVRAFAEGYYGNSIDGALAGSGPWTTNVTVRLTPMGQASISIQVTSVNGVPIAGASVGVSFEQDFCPNNRATVAGQTDAAGAFHAARPTSGDIVGRVQKAGYYDTYLQRTLGEEDSWSVSVPVVLKEKRNPIPMYAKTIDLEIPAENRPAAFDLVRSDWCAPYGQGVTTDFVFKASRRVASDEDYDEELLLTFPNPNDGIQAFITPYPYYGSELRLPHEAPATGYANTWIRRSGKRPETGYFGADTREDCNYFYRVGSPPSGAPGGRYGKIHGDIELAGVLAPKMRVRFTYYLNPDGTRNVEFNTQSNLFATPGGRGRISAP